MPLLDHFHPPLSEQRSWDAFHARWATALADALNMELLSAGYFAEALATLGRVEVDVATEREGRNGAAPAPAASPSAGGVATRTAPAWAPATHTLEMEVVFPDEFQVLVFNPRGGRALVGAIELVSPSNKDRPAARRAFAVKCLSYLQAGVGLIVADVVTDRLFNLHNEMADLLLGEAPRFPGHSALYAAAYRPFRRGEQERVGVWPVELALGQELPVLPLWLRDCETPIRIDLDAAYAEARQRCLIG